MGKYRICVYAICKNEQKFARRFMESARDADGVYVLDTGSTDDSAALLRDLGAVVETQTVTPWRFDTARNLSLAMVPQEADICVCLDLDEVLVPGWRRHLEAAWQPDVRQGRYKYVWSFLPEGGENVVFYADKVHARQGFSWIHPVHEILRDTQGGGRQALIAGMEIHHHPDPQKSRAQYLPLLEMAVAEAPQDDRNMHYLGREYLYRQEWDKCIAALERHLSLPTATWRDERCASLRYMARAYGAKGDPASQESCLLRAAAEAPHLREPWLDLARFAYARGDWETLLFACRRALNIASQPRTYITEAAAYGALPWDLYSIALWRLGLREDARKALEEALRLSPGDARLLNNRALMAQAEKSPNDPCADAGGTVY